MASRKKRALITGITGQDGSYLAEFLLGKGYEVHGLVRRTSTFNRQNIEHLFHSNQRRRTFLHYGDMTDIHSLLSVVREVHPDEIYNLAAQSHVRVSFDIPFYTAQSDAVGVLGLLEAVRITCPKAKIYQASTSELFSGERKEAPQSERTPFRPCSPYGAAKLYGSEIARIYRESYGLFVVNGILFNHESPRRGESFVSRKIVIAAVEIRLGKRSRLSLGNLDAARDWGYAPEYMEAAWKMLQQREPCDYVIATGQSHTVRKFAETAFREAGIELRWRGRGAAEKGIDADTGRVLIDIDPVYFRPNEVNYLRGNASKARAELGWTPKTTFSALVKLMVRAEQERYARLHLTP
ncbi:MAG TPA: GDP-mannose 4,6-dehydratase [Candidatus Paceibacterota bacterium]|nr:GDP-mannose 4,6-dehydratase [Candidatus Paceibacterota bacterium]